MSKHISRKRRWWTPSDDMRCEPRLRCQEGYVFQKNGFWHGMLFRRNCQKYLGKARRLRQAQNLVEEAIRCEQCGLYYPPAPVSVHVRKQRHARRKPIM